MANTTVYVGIDIEKALFISVIEIVHRLDGVAKVHMDFDQMFERKPAKVNSVKTNGAAPKVGRPGIKSIIVTTLFEAPAKKADLLPLIIDADYAPTSLSVALNELRRDGHIEMGVDHVYCLTATMPAKALPPPEPTDEPQAKEAPGPDTSTPFKTQGLALILRFFAQNPGPATTIALRAELDAARLPQRTLGNALQDGKNAGLLLHVSEGVWKASAKGLKQAAAQHQNG
jgi:hypothetical protein